MRDIRHIPPRERFTIGRISRLGVATAALALAVGVAQGATYVWNGNGAGYLNGPGNYVGSPNPVVLDAIDGPGNTIRFSTTLVGALNQQPIVSGDFHVSTLEFTAETATTPITIKTDGGAAAPRRINLYSGIQVEEGAGSNTINVALALGNRTLTFANNSGQTANAQGIETLAGRQRQRATEPHRRHLLIPRYGEDLQWRDFGPKWRSFPGGSELQQQFHSGKCGIRRSPGRAEWHSRRRRFQRGRGERRRAERVECRNLWDIHRLSLIHI